MQTGSWIVTEDERRPGGAVLARDGPSVHKQDCALKTMRARDRRKKIMRNAATSSLKEFRAAPKFNTGCVRSQVFTDTSNDEAAATD
jgi:hypothetical protein